MSVRDFLKAKLQLARAFEQLTNEKEQLAKEQAELVRAFEHLANEKATLAKEKAMAHKQLTNEKEQLGKELSQLMEVNMQLVRAQEQLLSEKEQLANERAQLENNITQLRLANAELKSECNITSKATLAAPDGMYVCCATHIWAVFQARSCPWHILSLIRMVRETAPYIWNCHLFAHVRMLPARAGVDSKRTGLDVPENVGDVRLVSSQGSCRCSTCSHSHPHTAANSAAK
jgi:hypothetical protein